jgi:ABC-type transporter Mla maintaining outer membrane lipid asymmetry ATPase subunit MlaF
MTNPANPLLEMRGVTAVALREPDNVVAENVDWTVAAGDYWVVGGLHGSGKSDFLQLAGGLTAPASGTYRFMGESMPIFDEDRLSQRLRLGFVFEGGQPFSRLTLLESVALPLCYHRNLGRLEADRQVWQVLELTGLEPWANSTPGAMPGYWQRRAGLARALMLKPEVLLLDNPLAGLDLRHRAWWLALLGHLSQGHPWMDGRPVTIVATADDLIPWRRHARQFAVLKDRQWIALGSWDKVESSADEHVHELLALSPSSG